MLFGRIYDILKVLSYAQPLRGFLLYKLILNVIKKLTAIILLTLLWLVTIVIVEAKEPPIADSPYIVAVNSPVMPPPRWTYCSCVEFAKHLLGRQGEKWGNASQISPIANANPKVGGLVLFKNHVAVIADLSESELFLDEGNQVPCQRTQRRIPIDDPSIRGYLVLD